MEDISEFLSTPESGAFPGIGAYSWRIQSDRLKWSKGLLGIYGLVEPPGAEKGFTRLVHPDDRVRVEATLSALIGAGETYEHEFRIVRPDGSVRVVHDRGVMERDAVGQAVVMHGVTVDVTAHRPRDAEDPDESAKPTGARGTPAGVTGIGTSETRPGVTRETFRLLVERSPFGIYTVDADLRIVHASEGAVRSFAGTDGLAGRELADVMRMIWPQDVATRAVALFRHTLETGEPYDAPPLVERRRDTGKIEAYDWSLERVTMPDGRAGVVCNFYDLSTREAEAGALRETAERLELAYEAAGMGAWDLDLRAVEAVWTPQLRRIMGVDGAAPTSAAILFDRVHPDDRPGLVAGVRSALHTGGELDAEFRIIDPDGEVRVIFGRGRVIGRDAKGPTRMIGVTYDVTERRRAERRVRESEARLRLVLDNSVAFMSVLDPDGTVREVNTPALDAGGLSRDQVLGRPFHETPFWSHDAGDAAMLASAIGEVREGRTVRYDAVARGRGDTRVIVDMMLAPIRGKDGRIVRIVASGVDVTDREAASHRVRMLMREINHRSKNLLTLVQIIARRTRADDPDDFHERFGNRLIALAGAQDLLVRDDTDGAFMDELIRSQLGHFSDLIGTRILIDGPGIWLDAAAAQHIGMAFHELATNAGKHGALSVETGTVRLGWSLVREGSDAARLALEWAESGGPPVEPPTRTGFGTIVIDRMIRDSLSAEVMVDYGPEGFSWRAVCATGFTDR
jgi:PAS domain S-box-containing protein